MCQYLAGVHARNQEFNSGGGVQVRQPENSLDNVFFFFFFIVLNLFYSKQRGSNGFITVKTILFKGSRGGPEFSRPEDARQEESKIS